MIFQFVLNSQLNIYGDNIIVFVVGRTGVGWFVQGQFYSGKNRFQSASPELSSGDLSKTMQGGYRNRSAWFVFICSKSLDKD